MQRLINQPDHVVEDMLEGFVKSKESITFGGTAKRVIKRKDIPADKVGLVSGGGSGHEPAFLGYVGEHMLDAVAVGEVFSSPTANDFFEAFQAADQGNGVACLFGNYAGDNMNVKMEMLLAKEEGIEVSCVTANDDISSSPKETKEKRHGIAGGVYLWKIAGAKASMGASLQEVITTAQKTVDQTRSICIGLAPCTIPDVGHPNFSIKEGTYEFGIGHHGEPGMEINKLATAKQLANKMLNAIHEDYDLEAESEVSLMISGLGATPLMELYILYHEVALLLEERNITILHQLVGNYVTSLDMNGVALTVLKLDEELKTLLDHPANCAAFDSWY